MTEKLKTEILDNGLVLLTESIPESEAASYVLRVPHGTIDDPEDRQGLAGMIVEMIVRGAGKYDNRELVYAFENLGIDASESVYQSATSFGAAMLADRLDDSLALTADILRRPWFPEEELEPARQVLAQELAGLEDEPSRLLMLRLGRNFFPAPWGRPSYGNAEGLAAVTLDDVRETYRRRYTLNGAVLSVAGKIDPDHVARSAEKLFGDWTGPKRVLPAETPATTLREHIPFESAQTHIGLAWPMVTVDHDDFLPLRCALGALSGGMSCRLFDEVREKRGLCYSVSASYTGSKYHGGAMCYCGSSNETAQQALDVIVEQLNRVSREGITQTELDRCKIRLKSTLVMSQESTAVHAGQMASDYELFGRVRTMDEILARIDAFRLETVNEKIAARPIGPFRLATLGPKELEIDPALLG
ncbi:MAG: insulinase family protein [Thermoguttaceae bacterium]|nr:insulinase family protein [Thermoguttaceae bacterium]